MAAKSSKDFNGAERFTAISPALGIVVPIRDRMVYELPDAAAKAKMEAEVHAAIKAAADKSGASVEEIGQWIEDFTFLGKAGLASPVPVSATATADALQGTWELVSRFTDGHPTNARSQLYYDVEPGSGRAMHLITMWTEQNHFERDPKQGTYQLVALVELTFRQNGPHEVVVNSKGRLVGNFGDYENGADVADEFRLVRRGNDARMVGVPSSYVQQAGRQSGGYTDSKQFNHALIYVGGSPGSTVFANWGLPPMGNKGRTLDVVDTYVHVNSAKPLVAGIEPIASYFERMTQPQKHMDAVNALGKKGAAVHSFQIAPNMEALLKYSDLSAIKKTMGQ
jgi:hypothetical protein